MQGIELTTIFLAVALAMDAFSVSWASGASYRKLPLKYSLRMAGLFGIFQAVMPIIGFFTANNFLGILQLCDHWIAFTLLSLIGGKMIYESFSMKDSRSPLNLTVVLVLAVATSIDALAVGITLSLIQSPIWSIAATIGIITFILSLIAVEVGKKLGHLFENKIEILGGLILIGIGLKILIEHLIEGK